MKKGGVSLSRANILTILKEKADCFGCTACYSICPTNAIEMKPDEEGFLYPSIVQNKCISCGKCVEICPSRNSSPPRSPLNIYATKNTDLNVRMRSSSGGCFSKLAQWVEQNNGVICGVTFDKNYLAVHCCAETENVWKDFCTSKYMQSRLGDTFLLIRNYLNAGRYVLFTGTPCQVDALNRYLAKFNTDRLITCDIVCHGVPSPKIWSDYLCYLSHLNHARIGSVNFRDKSREGWHNSTLTIQNRSGQPILVGEQASNCFFQLFFQHLILRPSCHTCPYANLSRPGDISIGDCWGIERHFPDFDDNKGVSLFMCNTSKGRYIWDQISESMSYISLSPSQCLQPNLCAPAQVSSRRTWFWDTYHRYGFKKTAQILGLIPQNNSSKIKQKIYAIPRYIKRNLIHLFNLFKH